MLAEDRTSSRSKIVSLYSQCWFRLKVRREIKFLFFTTWLHVVLHDRLNICYICPSTFKPSICVKEDKLHVTLWWNTDLIINQNSPKCQHQISTLVMPDQFCIVKVIEFSYERLKRCEIIVLTMVYSDSWLRKQLIKCHISFVTGINMLEGIIMFKILLQLL